MSDTKMVNRLLHWVSFEMILNIGIVIYTTVLFSKLGNPLDNATWWIATVILVARTILLFRVWLSTGGPKWAEEFGTN